MDAKLLPIIALIENIITCLILNIGISGLQTSLNFHLINYKEKLTKTCREVIENVNIAAHVRNIKNQVMSKLSRIFNSNISLSFILNSYCCKIPKILDSRRNKATAF